MIEQSVPKPSLSFVTAAEENFDVAGGPDHEPKRDGFGRPDPPPVAEACKRAQNAGVAIVGDLGAMLAHGDRRKILTAFRRILFPPRRLGRRRKETVTAAHRDWKNGMRGLALYRAHIPGWDKHNRYRRQSEARALMDAVRTRDRRERKRTARATKLK